MDNPEGAACSRTISANEVVFIQRKPPAGTASIELAIIVGTFIALTPRSAKRARRAEVDCKPPSGNSRAPDGAADPSSSETLGAIIIGGREARIGDLEARATGAPYDAAGADDVVGMLSFFSGRIAKGTPLTK